MPHIRPRQRRPKLPNLLERPGPNLRRHTGRKDMRVSMTFVGVNDDGFDTVSRVEGKFWGRLFDRVEVCFKQ